MAERDNLIEKVNAELENVLKIEDFIIEELPPLPLALEQGDPSYLLLGI